MTRDEKALRAAIIAKARWMNASGLNQGTSGNISARSNHVMLITPTAGTGSIAKVSSAAPLRWPDFNAWVSAS